MLCHWVNFPTFGDHYAVSECDVASYPRRMDTSSTLLKKTPKLVKID